MKLAVIGAGISGLVAAYRLAGEHDVTLFEANDYPGGHTRTVDVEVGGEHHALDVGFIVFNDRNYPNFCALLEELGIPSRPTTMGFSVSDERTGLEYNGHSLNTLFAQRRNLLRPSFYRLLAEIARFNREARRLVTSCDATTTVAEFLTRHHFSQAFAEDYLLPMGAAIWSCPIGQFARFPIRFIVAFYHNHGLLSIFGRPTWRYIAGGARTYVAAITRVLGDHLRLRTPVERVHRFSDHVVVVPRDGVADDFDHVIFACHGDQALDILGPEATTAEREILGAVAYVRNVALLHTDINLLPKSRRAWASWNYRVSGEADAPVSVTYNLNLLQQIRSRHTFCLTLNDASRIAPERVLRRFEFSHPVFSAQKSAAQARHAELLNHNRTSFCGAYWANGFHEDGVRSAMAVVRAIRGTAPSPRQASPDCKGVSP